MIFKNNLLGKYQNKTALRALGVFFLFLLLNSLLYFSTSGVAEIDDQWFHFAYANLLRTEGWSAVTNFNWLYFTNLAQEDLNYAVALYHYFLVLFTFIPDKIFGMKLAGVTMSAVFPACLYYVLKRFNVKNAFFWIIVVFAFGSFNFIFRSFIGRNFILVYSLVLIEILLISKRKYKTLFLVAALHVWWHAGTFWAAPLIALVYEAASYPHLRKINYRIFSHALAGSIIGFLFYPPNSDHLYAKMNPLAWGKTLVVFFSEMNSGIGIGQGTEAYPQDFLNFISNNKFLFSIMIFVSVLSIRSYIKMKKTKTGLDDNVERAILRDTSFLLFIIFFLGLTRISGRFEDVLIPFIFLGGALAFDYIFVDKAIEFKDAGIKKIIKISVITVVLVFFCIRLIDLRNKFDYFSYGAYEKATNWMKANTEKGEIIFNTVWFQFPRLFFYDHWNSYVIGIEPKSLYRYDKGLYWKWHNIAYNGIVCVEDKDCSEKKSFISNKKLGEELDEVMIENAKEIAGVVKNDFKSSILFFDTDTFLRREVDKNKEIFNLVYEDKIGGIFIYRIMNN